MRVEKIMTQYVTTCGPSDSLEYAASQMWNSDCGSLPVTVGDGARLLAGIITDRDICMAALFQGKPLRELRVEDSMSKNVIACQAGDQIEAAEMLMQQKQIRRLPVLDADGALIGIVSMADIVRESARPQNGLQHRIAVDGVMATLAGISAPQTKQLAS